MTEPTDAEAWEMWLAQPLTEHAPKSVGNFARAVLAKWGTPPPVAGEPIGHLYCGGSYGDELEDWEIVADQHQCDKLNEHHGALGKEAKLPLYATPQPTQAQAGAVPLTDREIELIDGMIQIQLDHASRCDAIPNRPMADKQKGWDMERVALLQKLKFHGIKGGQHG